MLSVECRFFTKMPADKPIQRGSWGLEVDQPLYVPPGKLPLTPVFRSWGKLTTKLGHPHEKYRDSQAPDVTLDRVHLRVDWQTLRRLPLSGAIVFNFKALFTPVADFRDEPYIPSLLLKLIKEGKENLMEYKNTWHTEHVAVPALERFQTEQIEKGMVEEEWEVETLDQVSSLPFSTMVFHIDASDRAHSIPHGRSNGIVSRGSDLDRPLVVSGGRGFHLPLSS